MKTMMMAGVMLGAAAVSGMASGVVNAPAPQTVVCLGDSITGQPNLKRYLKFSFILDTMFEARFGAGAYRVVNRGIGGDTTGGVLARMEDDVLKLKPSIVILLIGGNDTRGKIPAATIRKNLTEIIHRLKNGGCDKILLMQYHCIPNPERPSDAWTNLAGNNALIGEVAEAEGVALLHIGKKMDEAYRSGTTSELASRDKSGKAVWRDVPLSQTHLASEVDGVHLNSAGELVFARSIFAKLRELGWIK